MVKLNKSKIKWVVRQKKKGEKNSKIALAMGITTRRVQQLYKQYLLTKEIPMLKKERRPRTYLTEEQKQIIKTSYEKYYLGARLLKIAIDKNYPGNKIPYNKIHVYLKEMGYAKPDPKKQKQRKRCRYERKHSGSLLHGDGHRTTENHPHCLMWEDDASRRVLAGIESKKPITNELSIKTMKKAMQEAVKYNVTIFQANTDRGTEFFSNKKTKNPGSKSKFEKFLVEQGIQHIPSRIKNPQTNGKLERLWYEYDKHRWKFKTLKEFIDWYNDRIHGSLDLKYGETPNEAFIRKLRPESGLGLFFRRIE